MFTHYRKTKITLITIVSLFALLVGFILWIRAVVPASPNKLNVINTTPHDLVYLKQSVKEQRGKILAVVTSTDNMGSSDKSTGYELTELARAYYVFQANGFDVDIASPQGKKPPAVLDDDDMGQYDYAFLNDPYAQSKVNNSIALEEVDTLQYSAVYFVGGKGAMFDFPNNTAIQAMLREYYEANKVIGAVCHGPAALVNVTLSDGTPMINNKTVAAFTNEEELLLIPDAKEVFPFLLQNKLVEQGATFDEGYLYLNNIAHDGNLITGQNPWSVWSVAESMIKQLGYTPVKRPITPEENTINVLIDYEEHGIEQAKNSITFLRSIDEYALDRTIIAIHMFVYALRWEIGKSIDMIRLLSFAKI